jgi:putative transposase
MPLAPQEIRTFFVTSVTAGRRSIFQVERNAQLFIAVLSDNREKRRFALHAYVIMPDHFHLILTPAPDVPLERAMQFIKGGFSFRLKSKGDVWEKSFRSIASKTQPTTAITVLTSSKIPSRLTSPKSRRILRSHPQRILRR